MALEEEFYMYFEKNPNFENYEFLAKALDEIIARFIRETNNLPSQTSTLELLQWLNNKKG